MRRVSDPIEGSWQSTLDDLDARYASSRAMGGPARLAKQAAAGKLNARERLDLLLDPASFREIGTLTGGDVPADALVAGSGLIGGRPVMVGAEDFTTLAGSIGGGSNSKRHRIAELALQQKIPLIMLLEGAGFRPGGHSPGRFPVDLPMQARCSGKVPVVCGVIGRISRAWSTYRADGRLLRDDREGVDLHRRSTCREAVHR